MTEQEFEARVSTLLFDHPDMRESTAHAIACEYYTTEELLELKRRLSLDDDEFEETIRFIESRGGLENKRVGDNQKPVDAERTDSRGHSDPEDVEEGME